MPRINPCLWFDDKAEQAAKFYVSVFQNSKIGKIARYGKAAAQASGQAEGSVMTVAFQLDGQDFLALNGGPVFKFTEAISLIVHCETQDEVDYFWEKLCDGGEEVQCGWLKDRFGVSWQVVPSVVPEMMTDPDPERSQRVMEAIMQMKKLDIEGLKRAYGD